MRSAFRHQSIGLIYRTRHAKQVASVAFRRSYKCDLNLNGYVACQQSRSLSTIRQSALRQCASSLGKRKAYSYEEAFNNLRLALKGSLVFFMCACTTIFYDQYGDVSHSEGHFKHDVIKKEDFESRYGVQLTNSGSSNSSSDPKYTVVGLGAYGEVIKGYDKLRNRKVAIKIIDKSGMNSNAIKAEISALHTTRMHPNVLEFLELFDCPELDSWFIVTELCEGGELFETLIQNGAYSEGTASRLIARLISALKHIHKCGYVHLDVKPENLVFKHPVGKDTTIDDQVYDIKLVDFGMAKNIESLKKDQRLNSHVGTTAYWAPELLKPFMESLQTNVPLEIPIDHIGSDLRSCDMWAVGIITYILLLGCHPFDPKGTSTDQELALQIISGENPSLDIHGDLVVLSEEAKDFIRSLIDPDPKTRLCCKRALKHPWIKNNRHLSDQEKEEKLPDAHTRLREYAELTKAHRAFASAVLLASLASMERKKSNAYRVKARNKSMQDEDMTETTNFLKLAFNVLDTEGSGKVKPKHISNMLEKIDFESTDSSNSDAGEIGQEGICFDEFLEKIRDTYTLNFNAGDSVYVKGDKPKGLYIIVSGCAQVEYTCEKGKVRPVSQLGPGEIFGEVALLDGRDTYNATVTCTEPTEVLFWGKEDFVKAVTSSKELASSIEQSVSRKQNFRARTIIESMPNLKTETFKKGDVIFSEGEESSSLYLIRTGSVESFIHRMPEKAEENVFAQLKNFFGSSEAGDGASGSKEVEIVINTNKQGEILGSCALTGGHYSVTTRCLTDVEVIKITKHDLRELLAQPSLASNLIRLSRRQVESTWRN